jgi:hypothetical protein
MKVYMYLVVFTVCIVSGYYASISWKRPDILRAQMSWYAQLYDRWNPGEANWLRSRANLTVVRIAHIVGFVLALLLTLLVLLRY